MWIEIVYYINCELMQSYAVLCCYFCYYQYLLMFSVLPLNRATPVTLGSCIWRFIRNTWFVCSVRPLRIVMTGIAAAEGTVYYFHTYEHISLQHLRHSSFSMHAYICMCMCARVCVWMCVFSYRVPQPTQQKITSKHLLLRPPPLVCWTFCVLSALAF